MDIKTRRLIMNGPLFTVIYGVYTYLLLTLVLKLFNDAGNFLIIPFTLIIAGIYLFATVSQGIYPNKITHFLAVMSEIWKGTSIYLLIITIIMHFISWIVIVPKIFFGVVLLILVPLIAIYAVYNADKIRINNLNLFFENLVEDIKFIHISDVHIGAIRGNRLLNNIVNKINGLDQSNIDFVVITGDLADGSSPIDSTSFEALSKSKIPIYFTPGNHDFYPGINNVIKAAKVANITVLSNQIIEIKGTQLIGIPFANNGFINNVSKHTDHTGSKTSKKFADLSHSLGSVGSNNFDHDHVGTIENVDYPVGVVNNSINNINTDNNININNNNSYNNTKNNTKINTKINSDNSTDNNNINNNINNNDNSNYTENIDGFGNNSGFEIDIDFNKTSILLHHVPIGWELFKDIGIDLVLSGHTHGGQFFPFNYFVKKVFPYLRGLFEDSGKYLYVSDGIGTLTPPMRLGTKAEMVVFQLRKKK